MNETFSKDFLIQILMATLFSFLLYIGQYQVFPLIFIFILLASFFKTFNSEKRIKFIIILSLISILVSDSFFYTLNHHQIWAENINLLKFMSKRNISWEYTKALSLIGLFFMISLTFIYMKVKRISPLMFGTIILLILIFTYLYSPLGPISKFIIMAMLIIFSKSFWYFCINLDDLRFSSEKKISLLSAFKFTVPVWSFGFIRSNCVPNGWKESQLLYANNQSEYLKVQLSGIKLACWALLLKFIAFILYKLLFNSPHSLPFIQNHNFYSFNLVNPLTIGISAYNKLNIPWIEKISVMILNPLIYILREPAGDGGILIATVRMFGINAKKQVNKPYLATNFNDFFRRVYYYYNYILVEFFFIPLYGMSSRLNINKKIRLFFSVLISVFLGAIFVNYLRYDIYIAKFGPLKAFMLTLNRSTYFLGVALMASFSAISKKNTKVYSKKHFFNIITIFICYSFFHYLQRVSMLDLFKDYFGGIINIFQG